MFGYDWDFFFPWYGGKAEFVIFDNVEHLPQGYPCVYWCTEELDGD